MVKVVSVETVRKIEQSANDAGLSYDQMMRNAGNAVAARALEVISRLGTQEQVRVTVLVGPGNNGGDGLVAAKAIAEQSGALVRCYLLKKRDEADKHYKAVRDAGIFIADAEDDQRYRVLFNMVASAHIIVDALFGVGVRLPLEGDAAKLLRQVQAALKEAPEIDLTTLTVAPAAPERSHPIPRPYIIAVDCPSGLDTDSGAIDEQALEADETVTFIAAKPGLFIFPGAQAVGELTVAQIGIPDELLKDEQHTIADANTVRKLLPKRSQGSHKGTFGKTLIVGGSVNYTGAPALCAEASYRVGAGLVTVAAPANIVPVIGAHVREATYVVLPHDLGVVASGAAKIVRDEAAKYDALLIGPGIGREKTTGEMLGALLDPTGSKKAATRRTIGFGAAKAEASEPKTEDAAQLPPLVIDADGLYHLSQMESWWKLLPANTILTPHPGEMSQLTGMETEAIQKDRWTIAAQKAAEWNIILVLKGAHTLVAEPGGRVVVLPFKTAALATAGTGDVLAGMIAGLLAQGLQPFDAAVAAGYVHGLAGKQMEMQVGTRGTVAGDIAHYGLPQALRVLETR